MKSLPIKYIYVFALCVISNLLFASTSKCETIEEKELKQLWLKVIKEPGNPQLNIDYAELAEELGKYNNAELAYERILFFKSDHELAKDRLNHLKILTKPSQFNVTIILSSAYSTNASLSGSSKEDDLGLSEIIAINDDRKIGGRRWRSSLVHLADVHTDLVDSDLVYNKFEVGPVHYFNSRLSVIPSISLEFVHVDQNLDTHAIELKSLFELKESYVQSLSVSLKRTIGHQDDRLRTFNINSNASFSFFPELFTSSDSFSVVLNGDLHKNDDGFDSVGTREKFGQIGVDLRYSLPMFEVLFVEPVFGLTHKHYFEHRLDELENRNDYRLNTGFEISMYPPFLPNISLLFSYAFERAFSNDNDNRYLNNVFNFSTIVSF